MPELVLQMSNLPLRGGSSPRRQFQSRGAQGELQVPEVCPDLGLGLPLMYHSYSTEAELSD